MQFSATAFLAALAVSTGGCAMEETTTTTATTTRNLRGNVLHTRIVQLHGHQDHTPENNNGVAAGLRRPVEPLVDPQPTPEHHHHHYVTVEGQNFKGEKRTIVLDLDRLEGKIPNNAAIFTQNHHVFHDEDEKPKSGNVRGDAQPVESQPPADSPDNHLRSASHDIDHGHHRADRELHHDTHEHRFEGHIKVERHHEHHYHPHHPHHPHPHPHLYPHLHQESSQPQPNKTHLHHYDEEEEELEVDWKSDRDMYKLPTGLASHFNGTLFNALHDAPFRVYEEALGHALEEGESFPVFALPQWFNTTGVFTGFSKNAAPLIFENVQFLLHWDEIVSAVNSPVGSDLIDHIVENNFHASLIIGKSIGNGANVPFIGMIVCYYQFGNPKNVLVPFSKLEDFFDDTSERHLLDPNTKSLEMAALHDMLEQKRSNSTHKFYHPALAHTAERKARLENLEITHFQKLFQLLIRRSFLFSFGYADCLLNEPHGLRRCLDDTFYSLIKMETSVRGALDDQLVEQLAEINDAFHSKVSEACITVQGSATGVMYGSGSCYNANDLGAFVGNYGSF